MSNSKDVREILGFSNTSASSSSVANVFQHRSAKKTVGKNKFYDNSSPNVSNSSQKRPNKMAREVYNLLYNDSKDAPPLVQTDTISYGLDKGYKQMKAKLGVRKVRQWKWTPFTNSARNTVDLVLYHWRRVEEGDSEVANHEYEFAKLNTKLDPPVVSYTDAEYVNHLQVEDWSRMETDHLLDLCARFDLRFVVIHDRWDRESFKKTRSIEDLKERYYDIKEKMERVKTQQYGTGGSQVSVDDHGNHIYLNTKTSYVYDANHERKRKEQLNKLYNRTPEQVEEEEILKQELKQIEIRRRERERKATEMKRLSEVSSSFISSTSSVKDVPNEAGQRVATSSGSFDGGSARQKKGSSSNLVSLSSSQQSTTTSSHTNSPVWSSWINEFQSSTPPSSSSSHGEGLGVSCSTAQSDLVDTQIESLLNSVDSMVGIKFPDSNTFSGGVSTRSSRFKLPSSVGQKRIKSIDTMIHKSKIFDTPTTQPNLHPPMATLQTVSQFNSLRSQMAILCEMKAALTALVLGPLQSTCTTPNTIIQDGSVDNVASSTSNIPQNLLKLITLDFDVSSPSPSTDGRLSEVIDVYGHSGIGSSHTSLNADGSPLTPHHSMRKRKAAIEQSNVLKKIKNKQF